MNDLEREVNPLHSRYIELTARYKASWTFHRFLDGLQKFFGNRDLGQLAFDFPSLYKSLKEASAHLNTGSPSQLREELAGVEQRLARIVEALDEQDRRVSPSYLRLFFQRVRRYDERILIEMLHFYQLVQRERTWEADRIDKVDFLVSRLAESVAGPDLGGDRVRLAKVLDRLSEGVPLASVDARKVANRLKLVSAVHDEIDELHRFEELAAKDVVGHYRRLKHSLGMLYFERSLLPRVVEANALLTARIRDLIAREERRIFAEYERISKLERDQALGTRVLDAVAELRRQIDGFQRRVKTGTYRIDDLQRLNLSLESLRPLLERDGSAAPAAAAPPAQVEAAASFGQTPPAFGDAVVEELLGDDLRVLAAAIAACDPAAGATTAASSPRLLAHRILPREVEAWRRLVSGDACDRRLESFLFSAAALRTLARREADRLRGGAGATHGDPSTRALSAIEIAEWFLAQFPHFVERDARGPEPGRVRDLARLKIELMREYTELWLALFDG